LDTSGKGGGGGLLLLLLLLFLRPLRSYCDHYHDSGTALFFCLFIWRLYYAYAFGIARKACVLRSALRGAVEALGREREQALAQEEDYQFTTQCFLLSGREESRSGTRMGGVIGDWRMSLS
jgi:hypothetical protein